jgi:chromatin structure-remodeling complex subunit RSC1/2
MSSHQTNGYAGDRPSNINIAAANNQMPLQTTQTPQPLTTPSAFAPSHVSQYHQASASPAIGHQSLNRTSSFGTSTAQTFNPPHAQQYTTAQQSLAQHRGPAGAPPVTYKAPSPVEVWHLPDAANSNIPPEIRAQFQTDSHGRVLFFTAPPSAPPEIDDKKKLKHSPAYLAFRARQARERMQNGSAKRSVEQEEEASSRGAERRDSDPKRVKTTVDIGEIGERAVTAVSEMLADATVEQFKALYGEDKWEEALAMHLMGSTERQDIMATPTGSKARSEEMKSRGLTSLLDYKPPNEALEWRR